MKRILEFESFINEGVTHPYSTVFVNAGFKKFNGEYVYVIKGTKLSCAVSYMSAPSPKDPNMANILSILFIQDAPLSSGNARGAVDIATQFLVMQSKFSKYPMFGDKTSNLSFFLKSGISTADLEKEVKKLLSLLGKTCGLTQLKNSLASISDFSKSMDSLASAIENPKSVKKIDDIEKFLA